MISNSLSDVLQIYQKKKSSGKKDKIVNDGIRIINNTVKKADILSSFKKISL